MSGQNRGGRDNQNRENPNRENTIRGKQNRDNQNRENERWGSPGRQQEWRPGDNQDENEGQFGGQNWDNQQGGSRGQQGGYGQGGRGGSDQRQGQHSGKGPKGYQRSDERILEDVNEELARHGEIDASEIEIEVSNGEVTLTGTVSDRESKRLAEEVVEHCSGVKDVQNRLRVQQAQFGQSGQSRFGGDQDKDKEKEKESDSKSRSRSSVGSSS